MNRQKFEIPLEYDPEEEIYHADGMLFLCGTTAAQWLEQTPLATAAQAPSRVVITIGNYRFNGGYVAHRLGPIIGISRAIGRCCGTNGRFNIPRGVLSVLSLLDVKPNEEFYYNITTKLSYEK